MKFMEIHTDASCMEAQLPDETVHQILLDFNSESFCSLKSFCIIKFYVFRDNGHEAFSAETYKCFLLNERIVPFPYKR